MAEQVNERKVVEIPQTIAVRDLADRLELSPVELLKALIANGIMASITESIDYETAAIVAEDFGFELLLEGALEQQKAIAAQLAEHEAEEALESEGEDEPGIPWYIADEPEDRLQARPPVVTMMGHVDHGKTSLLDAIRETKVTAGESGGITQHTGAYTVKRDNGSVTFIDTPGHAAFTAMRARGAQATDIAILVVAADDGIMPTTREAIDHIRAAGVQMVVALNKTDLPESNTDRVLNQLSELGIVPEEWGGDTFVVRTSAETGAGLDELVDAILLTAEEHTPLGNPKRLARGTVLEGKIDPARGVIATILVQSGTLSRGDTLVIGPQFCKVRAMFDHTGKTLDEAPPSTPVEIMGLSDVPDAGLRFEAVKKLRDAKKMAAENADRERREHEATLSRPMTLEELFARAQAGEVKALNLIVKTDVQGTLQPVVESLEKLSLVDVRVEILRAAAGDISESDIDLAAASDAVVIGFRTSPDPPARRMAVAKQVEVREYDVIYKLSEDVQDIVEGMITPEYEDNVIGRAEVRATFQIKGAGRIAGCYVTEGVMRRNAAARVVRDGEVIHRSSIDSLKRFQDDAREVREGFECGVSVDGFRKIAEGDIIEATVRERIR
jgi:translation initiation factor IF-2